MEYKIIKICTGKIKTEVFDSHPPKKTAVSKSPIQQPTYVSYLGLEGDEHEYHGHGGVDKAICLYDQLDYDLWRPYIEIMPEYALFGENITTVGLTKDNIAIGDTFKFGSAVIQVTEGRGPCQTIAKKYNVPNLVKLMSAAHATGCYFRVLEEGLVEPDSQLELLSKHPIQFTIDEYNALKYTAKKNKCLLEKALKVDALPEEDQVKFRKQLLKLTT
ncbi:MOSC domain-containing protein [Macrococcus lamae]|uniref:MOSC domain-containing protein n=1 Tax=Macrococcus lamae TaxID=198484 RepID=A0A4R6BVD0_9STAP|nr:MOSC domain-containing protein [Macrococcus lamae]TDM12242.1 MOSC domain-containing protein [Macrococcus lamae]